MKTSESITRIAEALSLAQGAMTGAKKAADNPFFKSKYSDLAEVIRAISEPFAANGLSFIQSASFIDGKISVITRIMHKSGEWLESDPCELPPVKNDPQGYGSAISYAKRYSLQSFAGVPSIDDDGNDAKKHTAKPKEVPFAEVPSIDDDGNDATAKKIKSCKSLDELASVWKSLTADQHKTYAPVKDAMKQELAA